MILSLRIRILIIRGFRWVREVGGGRSGEGGRGKEGGRKEMKESNEIDLMITLLVAFDFEQVLALVPAV